MKKDTTGKPAPPSNLDLSFLCMGLPQQLHSENSNAVQAAGQWDLPQQPREYYSPRTDLRSAAPIFTPLSKDPFAGERPEHRRYLEQFHTKKCERDCAGASCISTHVGEFLRRPLHRLESGQWNYSSSPCSTQQCNLQSCSLAHSYDERLYHPDVYKTSYCSYPQDERSGCQGYGQHCPFAHSPQDLRLSSGKSIEQMTPTKEKEEKKDAYYDLNTFKISRCPDTQCNKKPCLNYHNPFDRRRDPSQVPYSSLPCKNVYNSPMKKFSHPDRCKNGDACKYAHTKFEAYYHPAFYKTQYCSKLLTHGTCKRGETCAFLHPEQPEAQPKSLLSQLLRSNQKLTEEHTALSSEFESLKEEMTRLKKKVCCPLCRKSDKAVYLSCGHLLCQGCSTLSGVCPVCAVECVPLCALRL